MGSLLDISAAATPVDIGGASVDVRGISAKGLAALMQRFPVLRDAILGKGLDLTPEALAETGPDVVAAIIAAGCGFNGNEKAEGNAADIPLGHQIELLAAILTATLPGGAKKVFGRLGDAAAATGLSLTPSPEPSLT